jgi:hypothetical protein
MTSDFSTLVAVVQDESAALAARTTAVGQLAEIDPGRAKDVLIATAARSEEDPRLLEAAGRALARCSELASLYLTEWDCRDMSEIAYDAYWEAVP